MPSSSPSVLAVDLGGTGLRAGLVGQDGQMRLLETVPQSIAAEVDPEQWWQALGQAATAIAHQAGSAFDAVQALSLTGMTRTQVLLRADRTPLRPAITFADTRAASLLAELPPPPHAEAAHLNAYHPAARLLWIARHEPAVLAAAHAVVDPKDYLAARLTGRICTDPISAARLLAAAAPPGTSVLDALGLPSRLVPDVLAPGSVIGAVRRGLDGELGRLAGRPVVMAAHDTWACVLGMGALRDGMAYNLSGTTEVFGVLSRHEGDQDGLLSADWGGGLRQLGGPSTAGGATAAWLANLLTPVEQPGGALDQLLAAPRQKQPALFLPHLDGERTPFWDPELRGAFLGLTSTHGRADLAWAVLEGVAYLNRLVLARAEAVTGRVACVRFGGGGAQSAAWAQVKADMLDRPVVTTEATEPGLLGAGIVAWTALGLVKSLQDGQNAMVRTARSFEPASERRAFYDRLYAAYRQAHDAVAPISRMLARFG